MSYSFSETLETDLDYCRLKLDDTDEDDYRASDEMITACISLYGVPGALVELCNRIRLFYGKEPDRIGLSNGRLFSFRDRYAAYQQLYEDLTAEFNMVAGAGTSDNERSGILDFPCEVVRDYLPYQGIDKIAPLGPRWPLDP